MADLLYLRASLFADNGNSSHLAAAFIERWQAATRTARSPCAI